MLPTDYYHYDTKLRLNKNKCVIIFCKDILLVFIICETSWDTPVALSPVLIIATIIGYSLVL